MLDVVSWCAVIAMEREAHIQSTLLIHTLLYSTTHSLRNWHKCVSLIAHRSHALAGLLTAIMHTTDTTQKKCIDYGSKIPTQFIPHGAYTSVEWQEVSNQKMLLDLLLIYLTWLKCQLRVLLLRPLNKVQMFRII
jgi:hypothetical protein